MVSTFQASLKQTACTMSALSRTCQLFTWGFGMLLLIYAQDVLYAQDHNPWMVRAELGRAEIHRAASDGTVFGLRVGRNLERQGLVRLDLGLSFSTADEDYLSLDTGLELRPTSRHMVTLFFGARAGLIVEPEYLGIVWQGGAGIDFNLGRSTGLRFGVYRGAHIEATGPHLIIGGLEHRF